MQGRKEITPKMLYQVHLDDLVPQDNFYRRLNEALDLHFLYKATAKYYGTEGQESIDPVVFFKICLVGYLNNINSDRKLIEYCSDSLAIRLFLKYDIDESLPWHSTISRTRQLYGEEVFLSLFKKVLSMCIEKGMVRGKRQAIDSAYIKANASMDSLVEKPVQSESEIIADVESYAHELNEGSEYKLPLDKKNKASERKDKSKAQVSAVRKKLVERHHRWKEEAYKDQPSNANSKQVDEHGNLIRPKYLSNHTHYSPTDPDARISVKPGKARQLNYTGQLAVDDAHHVITGALADYADKRDSESLQSILQQTQANLKEEHLKIEEITADTGYSSGEALAYLATTDIDAYIPNFGQYIPEREGFRYNREQDQYECIKQGGKGAILSYKGERTDSKGYIKKTYRSSETVCGKCPLRESCCGKATKFKKIDDSVHKPLYDKMHQKMQTGYAKRMMRIRSKTVEPVLGTLMNFLNMRRVNTRGIAQANKHVLMAALTYNLKKYLKFITKKATAQAAALNINLQKGIEMLIFGFKARHISHQKFTEAVY